MKLRVGKHVYKKYDGHHRRIIYTIYDWNRYGVLLYYIDDQGQQQEDYSTIDNLVEADPFEEPFACILDDLKSLYSSTKSGGPLNQRQFIDSLNKFVNDYTQGV